MQSLWDDQAAIDVLAKGIEALTAFYKSNKLPLEPMQEPEYTVDKDKAPETSWEGGNSGGKKGHTGGIISFPIMLKEDLENGMMVAKKDDAEAQALQARCTGGWSPPPTRVSSPTIGTPSARPQWSRLISASL